MYYHSFFTESEELALVLGGVHAVTAILVVLVAGGCWRSWKWTLAGVIAAPVLVSLAYVLFSRYHRWILSETEWVSLLEVRATSSRFAITVGLLLWAPLIILGAMGWFRDRDPSERLSYAGSPAVPGRAG